MPGNNEMRSRDVRDGGRCFTLVTLALKLCTGDESCVVVFAPFVPFGLICEWDVEGREFSRLLGMLQAFTTEDQSFGCIKDALELDVEGRELGGLQSIDSCLFGDDMGDRIGLMATGLDVYRTILASNWSIVDGKRCILPEKPHTTFLPALESESNAFRITDILSPLISSLFCSMACLAISATRFPS